MVIVDRYKVQRVITFPSVTVDQRVSSASVVAVVAVATITRRAGTVFVFRGFAWDRTVWSVWNVLLNTSGLRRLLG